MNRIYRLYLKMHNSNNNLYRKIIRLYIRIIYSCDIMPETIIGENTIFAHNGLGVVIHPNAIIGKNVRISQNVTIGGKSGCTTVPKIGNNVHIGASALILGPINIGSNCIIGAGSVVVKSVPDNAVVVGNPGRIIKYVDVMGND